MQTNQDVINQLKELSKAIGSQVELAGEIGISPTYLSDVIHGRRDPGPAITDYLKIMKVIGYEPITDN
jgi:DNA-binding transcriptional regulator YdaS (Cro superfamily)